MGTFINDLTNENCLAYDRYRRCIKFKSADGDMMQDDELIFLSADGTFSRAEGTGLNLIGNAVFPASTPVATAISQLTSYSPDINQKFTVTSPVNLQPLLGQAIYLKPNISIGYKVTNPSFPNAYTFPIYYNSDLVLLTFNNSTGLTPVGTTQSYAVSVYSNNTIASNNPAISAYNKTFKLRSPIKFVHNGISYTLPTGTVMRGKKVVSPKGAYAEVLYAVASTGGQPNPITGAVSVTTMYAVFILMPNLVYGL